MDFDKAITVTKIYTKNKMYYVMVGWQTKSFEMYLFDNDKVWKGFFSPNRLAGLSRNLQMSEKEYIKNTRYCLSHHREDHIYELKSGFFYWKRKAADSSIIIEGFLPMDIETAPTESLPNLVEVLLALNEYLIIKAKDWKCKYKSLETEYNKCLKDTEDFLNLKIDMDKALCNKFLKLLNMKKYNTDNEGDNKCYAFSETLKELQKQ
ncbi:uncharacterized protein LOC126966186 [Leptidea sinapis]|uniref:uncharacterized protein LOC126966186 n=1 Tax=Leptidea sinapis TaxID=189913 RepID=UPI0021C4703F|nr:uncharacterized protein LOC126966186 [Leptidea sinapis]